MVIDNEILTTIRELFNACGAQDFSNILSEVATQCGVKQDLQKTVKTHLNHLVSMGIIMKVRYKWGYSYGYASDF